MSVYIETFRCRDLRVVFCSLFLCFLSFDHGVDGSRLLLALRRLGHDKRAFTFSWLPAVVYKLDFMTV